jgi:hypothetical protein
MALSNLIVHEFDSGTSVLSDGSDPVLSHTLRFDEANLSLSDYIPDGVETVEYQYRQELRSVRGGRKVFPKLSVSMAATEFTEASTGTIYDFLLANSGTPYASRVSVDTALSELFLFDWVFTMNVNGSAAGTATFTKCRCTGLNFAEGSPNSITFEVTIYGTATFA